MKSAPLILDYTEYLLAKKRAKIEEKGLTDTPDTKKF
jgi:hypothetical protein